MELPERPEVRVGDAERDAVVDSLKAHFGAGRLSLDEFEERTAQALAARTVGELVPLTADLPVARPAAVPAAGGRCRPTRGPGPTASTCGSRRCSRCCPC